MIGDYGQRLPFADIQFPAMGDEAETSSTKDNVTTIMAVVASFLLVGLTTPLLPLERWSGWASAAAFTSLVFLYAWLVEAGKRSGLATYVAAGLVLYPVIMLWVILVFGVDNPMLWEVANLEVGLRLEAMGHAAEFGGLIWCGGLILMICLAVLLRELIEAFKPDRSS